MRTYIQHKKSRMLANKCRYQTTGIKEVKDMSSDIRHQVSRKSGISVQLSYIRYLGRQGYDQRHHTTGIKEIREIIPDIKHQISRRSGI